MTFVIQFDVEGDPVAKGRPKFSQVGGFVRTYTPKKTQNYEEHVAAVAKEAMGTTEPLETPVGVFLYFRMPIPASYSKKRTQACLDGWEKHTKRPDLDNLIKTVLDGLNGVVFKDDCQIVALHCTKVYSTGSGVSVMVKEELA